MKRLGKLLKWLTEVEFKYKRAKENWRKQGKLSKILHLVIIFAFMVSALAIFYFTLHLFTKISTGGLAEVVWSILIIFGIILLLIIDFVLIGSLYKDIIINAVTAFVCRPPKLKNHQPIEQTNETQGDVNTQQYPQTDNQTLTYNQLESKTSRGFDTTMGVLSIVLAAMFTVGIILSALLAIKVIKL